MPPVRRRSLAALAVVLLVAGAACLAPVSPEGPGPVGAPKPAPGEPGSVRAAEPGRDTHGDPGAASPPVRSVLDRTDAVARAAVADAVALAVREARRAPAPDPGNATYGGVVDGPDAPRDRLRLRIYLAARRALSTVAVRAGGDGPGRLRGRASLPAARNASELRAAIGRVRLHREGGLLRVGIRGATVAVERAGRVAAVRRPTLRVAVGIGPRGRPGPVPSATGDDSHLTRPTLATGMFHEELRELSGRSVADLRREYAADLAGAVESAGTDAAVERTGLDRETVAAVADGEVGGLSLADAAAVAALAEGTPDAETIVEIACDHLLLGMSTAVLDVDTVAGNVGVDVTPKEVQQKLERRAPMTFEEYVEIQHFIADRQGEAF